MCRCVLTGVFVLDVDLLTSLSVFRNGELMVYLYIEVWYKLVFFGGELICVV